MSDRDHVTARHLRFERVLAAPLATVWRYLVDPELRARWFMGGAIDPRPGGKITLTMDHDNLSDGDVAFPERYAPFKGQSWTETITAIDPPRMIAFTWNEGDQDVPGTVRIELEDVGAQRTRLVLTHTGLTGPDQATNFGGGWHAHLATLQKRLAGEPTPDFWALHAASEKHVAALLSDVA